MVPGIVFQARPALGAQALAILPTHRLERQLGDDGVAQYWFEVDLVVLDGVLLICFVTRLTSGHGIKNEEFLNMCADRLVDRIQAATAFPVNTHGGNTADKNTIYD